jgi:mannose/fructose/N-acetylgalactosamine-specific phosphotransferase system component IIC
MNPVILSAISAVIILDKYSFGEFGISQPIVTGAIIGALCGNIQAGIFIGSMLQLIFLGGLPIGRDIPPDGQAAGLIGTGSYFLLRTANPSGQSLSLAIVMALIGAIAAGAIDILVRRVHERFYRIFIKNEHKLSICHLLGLVTGFIRGLVIFLPIFILSTLITLPQWFPYLNRDLLIIVSISIGMANALYLFVKKSKIVYVIIGGLCGLALVVF